MAWLVDWLVSWLISVPSDLSALFLLRHILLVRIGVSHQTGVYRHTLFCLRAMAVAIVFVDFEISPSQSARAEPTVLLTTRFPCGMVTP